MDIRAALLRDIRDYCHREVISLTAFGLRAVNDGKFVSRLEAGKNVTLKNCERARRLIDGGLSKTSTSEAA